MNTRRPHEQPSDAPRETRRAQVRRLFKRMHEVVAFTQGTTRGEFLLLIPGVAFMVVGVAIIIAPDLALCLLGAVFLYLGVLWMHMVRKSVELRAKLRENFKNIDARIFIRGNDASPEADPRADSKKIFFH